MAISPQMKSSILGDIQLVFDYNRGFRDSGRAETVVMIMGNDSINEVNIQRLIVKNFGFLRVVV